MRVAIPRSLKSTLAGIAPGDDPAGLVTRARWDLAMIERDYAAADQAMISCPLDVFQSNGLPTPKSFFRGCVALARGDQPAAQALFAAALPEFEKAVQQAPDNALRHANLGLLYSFMGRKDEAIREGRRAVELAARIQGCPGRTVDDRFSRHDLRASGRCGFRAAASGALARLSRPGR